MSRGGDYGWPVDRASGSHVRWARPRRKGASVDLVTFRPRAEREPGPGHPHQWARRGLYTWQCVTCLDVAHYPHGQGGRYV